MNRLVVSLPILVLLAATSARAQNGSPGPSAAASSAAKAREVTVPNDYRLVVGDKLRIEVYKDPQLSQSLQIRPDGKITLPLVGDIVAAGQTPVALRESIAGSLRGNFTLRVPSATTLDMSAE